MYLPLPDAPFDGQKDDPLFVPFIVPMTTAVERAVGKSLAELRAPDEIVAAFDAWPSGNGQEMYKPDLLHWLWRKGRLNKEVLRRVLLDAWRYTDFPTAGCPSRVWRAMFRTAGFLSDGVAKPTRRRILYRGCTPEGRRGMSWTEARRVAEELCDSWFEKGQAPKRGHLYKTVADPGHVLALIRGGEFRPEFEFIIDVTLVRFR
jgi:hypothetical protein